MGKKEYRELVDRLVSRVGALEARTAALEARIAVLSTPVLPQNPTVTWVSGNTRPMRQSDTGVLYE
jgi:hypothetical protein